MNKLLNENYDKEKHGELKQNCDAFGNLVEPPKGFRLLKNEIIIQGDLHFDIYNGWVSGGEDWHVRNKYYSTSEGRWRAWARKV